MNDNPEQVYAVRGRSKRASPENSVGVQLCQGVMLNSYGVP